MVAFVCILIFRKNKILITKWVATIFFLTMFVMYNVIMAFPVEIKILSFISPETAFHYSHSKDIIKTIESDDCAFIIYKGGNRSFNFTYVNKEDGVWRMQNPQITINEKHRVYDPLALFIVRVVNEEKNKQLVVIEDGLLQTDSKTIIKDSLNSQFTIFDCKPTAFSSGYRLYYAIINADAENYSITINNDIIDLS